MIKITSFQDDRNEKPLEKTKKTLAMAVRSEEAALIVNIEL